MVTGTTAEGEGGATGCAVVSVAARPANVQVHVGEIGRVDSVLAAVQGVVIYGIRRMRKGNSKFVVWAPVGAG